MEQRHLLVLSAIGIVVFSGCTSSLAGDPETETETDTVDAQLYNVGVCPTDREAGVAVAKEKATTVRKVIDFGDMGSVVNGKFNETAREELRAHPAIEYVEPDRTGYALDDDGSGSGTSVTSVDGNACDSQQTARRSTTHP